MVREDRDTSQLLLDQDSLFRVVGLLPQGLDVEHTGVAPLAPTGVDPSEIACRGAGHSSVAFTYDRYGHLFFEVDVGAAAKFEALRNFGQ